MTKPLTKEQVEILKKSFRKLDTEPTALLFYERLFERHPQVKPLFTIDMKEQSAKLMSVFELVVFSFEEKRHGEYELQDSVIAPLQDLGRKHDDKGIVPEQYAIVNKLLLEVMTERYPQVMDKKTQQSWSLALEHLTATMLSKPSGRASGKSDSKKSFREFLSTIRKKIRG